MDKNSFLKGKYENNFDQIVLGSLLGDGMLEIPRERNGNTGNCVLKIKHSGAQLKYLEWISESLCDYGLCGKNPIRRTISYHKRTGKEYESYLFESRRSVKLSMWEKDFYKHSGKRRHKIVTRRVLNRLEPLGLAIWWMDDGHLAYNIRTNGKGGSFQLVFSTEGFSVEENFKIQQYFKLMWGINWRVQKCGKDGSGVHLACGITEGSKFFDIIRGYVHSSLIYKITPEIQKEKAIERWKIRNETKRQPSLMDEDIVGTPQITQTSCDVIKVESATEMIAPQRINC